MEKRADLTRGPITALLTAYQQGESQALQELFDVVSPELRRIAGRLMRNERSGHLLQPTGLVNEAFLRLFNGKPIPYGDSTGFFAASVRHMRRVLTDYARARLAQKRQESVDHSCPADAHLGLEEIIDLNRVLGELLEHQPLAAQIVGLKFYAGLTIEEIAAALNTSERNVVRSWTWARTFLHKKLNGAKGSSFAPFIL